MSSVIFFQQIVGKSTSRGPDTQKTIVTSPYLPSAEQSPVVSSQAGCDRQTAKRPIFPLEERGEGPGRLQPCQRSQKNLGRNRRKNPHRLNLNRLFAQ